MTGLDIGIKLLELVAAVAPGLVAAITSKQTDDEALAHARAVAQGLGVRLVSDAADLARRERGE